MKGWGRGERRGGGFGLVRPRTGSAGREGRQLSRTQLLQLRKGPAAAWPDLGHHRR